MFMSFSKTESVSLHLIQTFPLILKSLFTGPTINEHIKVNYNYYYLNIEIVYYCYCYHYLNIEIVYYYYYHLNIEIVYYYYYLTVYYYMYYYYLGF